MKTLKQLVEEKTGINASHQQLIYVSRYMQDDKKLSDYEALQNGSNIMLVMRLPGGSMVEKIVSVFKSLFFDNRGLNNRSIDSSLPRSDGKCLITHMNYEDDGVIVLEMPCGHAMSPEGLMEYCWNEIKDRKTEIKCPLCEAVWSVSVIRQYGGATATEMQQLEMGIEKNVCFNSSDINQCPKCESYITRKDPKINSVKCLICSKKTNSDNYFCWYCLRDWKNPLSSSTCGNFDCRDAERLANLRDSGKVKVDFVKIEIYKKRACPHCGSLIEHAEGCKHIQCDQCKTEFCFICLRRRTQGSWQCGDFNTECVLASIQTVIPCATPTQ